MALSLKRAGILLAAGISGALFGLAGLIIWQRQGSLPTVTEARYQEACRQWDLNGPSNYNIEIAVSGRQSAKYYVEVRRGATAVATRNGQPLTQERTRSTWSVPGMFGTLGTDVDHLRRRARDPSDLSVPSLLVRVKFHPEYGYPERYHRIEFVRMGANMEVSWEVIRFEVINETNEETRE